MQQQSVFIKTNFQTLTNSNPYENILRSLHAIFADIKMDDGLPSTEQRSIYHLYLIDGAKQNWHDLLSKTI
jgi:LuxR family transcriptional regulator, positive regulator of biofilm formation